MNIEQSKKTLFQLLFSDITTGMNLYESDCFAKSSEFKMEDYDYILCYMHTDLGNEDPHKKELDEILKNYKRIFVTRKRREIVDRLTDYSITKESWINDLEKEDLLSGKVKLIDEKFNIITDLDKAKKMIIGKKILIREEKQLEMRVLLNKEEIGNVLDILDKNVLKYQFDCIGRILCIDGKEIPSKKCITNSWEVPVIIVNESKSDLLDISDIHKSYKDITKIDVSGFEGELSFFIGEKLRLAEKFLDMNYNNTYEKTGAISHVAFKNYMDSIRTPLMNRFEAFRDRIDKDYKEFSKIQ